WRSQALIQALLDRVRRQGDGLELARLLPHFYREHHRLVCIAQGSNDTVVSSLATIYLACNLMSNSYIFIYLATEPMPPVHWNLIGIIVAFQTYGFLMFYLTMISVNRCLCRFASCLHSVQLKLVSRSLLQTKLKFNIY